MNADFLLHRKLKREISLYFALSLRNLPSFVLIHIYVTCGIRYICFRVCMTNMICLFLDTINSECLYEILVLNFLIFFFLNE